MAPRTIDLEPYKTEIISLFQDNNSCTLIAKQLQNKYSLQIAERTIRSRLQEWRIRKRNRTTTSDLILHARIQILYFQVGLEDKDMLGILQAEGFEITDRTLKRLRTQLGLRRRTNLVEAQQQIDEIAQEIQKELEQGTIEGYGKELLHRHFRSKGLIVAR